MSNVFRLKIMFNKTLTNVFVLAVIATVLLYTNMAKAQPINVAEYGAKGDGATDDTSALQAALDAAKDVGGGIVFIPKGTYKTTDNLYIYSNTILQGEGAASIIHCDSLITDDAIVKAKGTSDSHLHDVVVRDLRIECDSKTGDGVNFWGVDYGRIEGCWIVNTNKPNECLEEGIVTYHSTYCIITNNITDGVSQAGIEVVGGDHIVVTNNHCINAVNYNANSKSVESDSIYLWGTQDCVIANNSCINNQ